MAELILKIFNDNGDDTVFVPLETAICLSVIDYTNSSLDVVFISQYADDNTYKVKYNVSGSNINFRREKFGYKCLYTMLPTVVMDDEMSYIAGLAAVLRQIIKSSNKNDLLGFRNCCLAAPAETSCWTRFCEIDIVNTLPNLLSSNTSIFNENKDNCLPEELAILEHHLSIPAKVHNRGKYGKDGPNHDYVEGPHMVVSDLVIALSVHLILDYLRAKNTKCIPFTQKWLSRVLIDDKFSINLIRISNIYYFNYEPKHWILPELKNGPVDLYKKEGTRRKRIFTQGDLLSKSLNLITEIKLMDYSKLFDLSELESIGILLPDVPKDRLNRKIQQLSNLAKAALQIAKDGDIIVDFCCGSGHLGLLLASHLPSCTIILLDNKEKSMERARSRVVEMNLKNVKVIQSNLDYFTGKFQVGMSLHACGVATDLVIKKCLDTNAHLVVCPCCYGGIQSNHVVKYPQSSEFINANLSEYNFIVLAHNADTYDTEDGQLAMTAVDTDRCLYVTENGYKVTLSKLQPSDCTTRNNMIVALCV